MIQYGTRTHSASAFIPPGGRGNEGTPDLVHVDADVVVQLLLLGKGVYHGRRKRSGKPLVEPRDAGLGSHHLFAIAIEACSNRAIGA